MRNPSYCSRRRGLTVTPRTGGCDPQAATFYAIKEAAFAQHLYGLNADFEVTAGTCFSKTIRKAQEIAPAAVEKARPGAPFQPRDGESEIVGAQSRLVFSADSWRRQRVKPRPQRTQPEGRPCPEGRRACDALTCTGTDVSSIASLSAQSTTERRRRGAAVSPGWSEAESWVGVHYKSESLQGRQALTPTAECIPGS